MSGRRGPAIRCEAVDTADFGYGDVEEHPCRRPATHRAHGVERVDGAARPVKVRVCAFHAARDLPAPTSDPWGSLSRAYRYRKAARS